MSVCGRYVATFSEASHAIPEGMHMNADYPFMLPCIDHLTETHVTIRDGRRTETAKIVRDKGREFFYLSQSSAFEMIYNRKPTRFKFHPFKDEQTEAVGGGLFK